MDLSTTGRAKGFVEFISNCLLAGQSWTIAHRTYRLKSKQLSEIMLLELQNSI